MNTQKFFEANKKLWNERVSIHSNSDFYDLEGFKKGKSSLQPVEIDEMGDVFGKEILHLQCHFGLDSLSWARMGAKVTGVDFSEEGIKLAKSLNDELQLNAEFICSNIYDLDKNLDKKFDMVFTSYGTIGWLNDLQEWGRLISKFLTPGGFFYIVDFHNMMWMYDDDFKYFKYSYFFKKEPIKEEFTGSYADKNSDIKNVEYGWNHPLSEVINSLVNNGMRIDFIHEFPYSTYDIFPNSVKDEKGFYRIKGMEDILPMMFSIKATKF